MRDPAALPVALGAAVGLLLAVLLGGLVGVGAGAVAGVSSTLAARTVVRGGPIGPPVEPTLLAGAWDLLAASLRCGLPVATAVRVVAGQLSGANGLAAGQAGPPGQQCRGPGAVLDRVAQLLALGADAHAAWRPALGLPATAGLAAAAIRTARSGAAMADAVDELAAGLRADATDRAEARAQRAGVLITGPLGLCFLPAFFCLGVLPVVIGLAEQLLGRW